jgi:hypothetical protein
VLVVMELLKKKLHDNTPAICLLSKTYYVERESRYTIIKEKQQSKVHKFHDAMICEPLKEIKRENVSWLASE